MHSVSERKGLQVLFAATGINLVSGLLYIWSVISKSLVRELNWTSKEASLPYTIATVSMVIAMVLLGKVQDVKGPRFTATIGSLLLGTGFILSGFTRSPLIMVVTFGIMTGSGMGILNLSTISAPSKWFSASKKGMITGTVVAGVGLSSVLYSPLSNYLIITIGSSKTFIYIGTFALIIACSLSQLLRTPPKGYTIKGNSNNNLAISNSIDFTWKEMLSTVSFYKLWVMLAFSASAGLMIIGHATNIAIVQINWEGGFILVILLAIFNTLGRFLGGSISDKIGRINLMRTIFIAQAINMLIFSKYSSITTLAIGVAIAGLCYGATFSVFPATCSDLYGTKSFGINYGLLFTGWGFGGIIGPMTGAYIFDLTKSYSSSYLIAFILLTISLLITFKLKTSPIPLKTTVLQGDH
ncbi:OFA family MFS transporter [Serpentinicella alkaliphila]|uniref:Nitrate/nitrite transporter NarK n=1 Tax=Serpentinicella alkaliphila TaxID=1734049 RepID=A0A4R2T671_9FIRM|nr:OFA family MFS transporter [Serpentinicella alkaliphila]QUH26371.1 OFA family MFS transporter [Serpentinicella alkaliphila]TCP97605.1 nitrate/nitrite transporter NarK [Serpentinicella alkaliphila]